MRIDGYRDIFL
ncbi:uncharacterized protein FTOL_13829 [Fusarium torulosum]|uniref:Uncharacterized protein n=1 Tax=Fusarium torulosum TaxID=33205 RepID=A0AAE8MPR1_9HYPO|nr:uncharacterized protein FTOL_13829 [Fusarium torulosum]